MIDTETGQTKISEAVHQIVDSRQESPKRCVTNPEFNLADYLKGLHAAQDQTMYVARCLVNNGWTADKEIMFQRDIILCGETSDGKELVQALKQAAIDKIADDAAEVERRKKNALIVKQATAGPLIDEDDIQFDIP